VPYEKKVKILSRSDVRRKFAGGDGIGGVSERTSSRTSSKSRQWNHAGVLVLWQNCVNF